MKDNCGYFVLSVMVSSKDAMIIDFDGMIIAWGKIIVSQILCINLFYNNTDG